MFSYVLIPPSYAPGCINTLLFFLNSSEKKMMATMQETAIVQLLNISGTDWMFPWLRTGSHGEEVPCT